ncbi:TolB family protein [Ekhidna sp.]|uniref:TolB family protein n=1 Tax=Ekhidna sp. TaxID=2608089 RepID=UPI003CCB741C
MRKFLFAIIALFSYSFSQAQPSTEIYVMDLRRSPEGLLIEKPQNISNNEGYDNQPSFWVDGESVLYARTINGQTDVARYYFDSKNTLIISDTKQGSEYSPTPMPDSRISSIRLDTTGLQLLYAYKFDGSNEVLVPDLKIGYHAWIDADRIVAFVLGEPATMQIVNTKSGEATVVGEKIGRSLHKIPDSKDFSYLDKSSEKWVIKRMNPASKESAEITTTIGKGEDYCWTPKGEILMADGAKLFVWSENSEWKQFADLSKLGITSITRLSVSPDGKKLAIAAE